MSMVCLVLTLPIPRFAGLECNRRAGKGEGRGRGREARVVPPALAADPRGTRDSHSRDKAPPHG
jgi:hypothetical protein